MVWCGVLCCGVEWRAVMCCDVLIWCAVMLSGVLWWAVVCCGADVVLSGVLYANTR